MDLINETNSRIQEILDNLENVKREYEEKIEQNKQTIQAEVKKSQQFKDEFYEAKAKVEKMNSDIEGFQSDYQNLVDKFKDDELANILIAANKEISAKIEERKRKILRDREAMNELVKKAESVKAKLVKLTAEKKALELCLRKILDAYFYYSDSLNSILTYTAGHADNLSNGIADIDTIVAKAFELDEQELEKHTGETKDISTSQEIETTEVVEEAAIEKVEEKIEEAVQEIEAPKEETIDTDFQNIYLDTIVLDEVDDEAEKNKGEDFSQDIIIPELETDASIDRKNKKNKKNKKNRDLDDLINADDSLDD